MTRVAYVCADPGIPVFGTKGASVHIQEIVRAWRRRGAEVEVYAVRLGDVDHVPADLADLVVHHVPVGRVGSGPGGDDPGAAARREVAQRQAAAEIGRRVVAAAPDVVYERYSLFSGVLHLARRGLGGGVRTVLEVNAPLIDEQRRHRVLVDEAGSVDALRAQVGAADVVACVSERVAAWVRERTGADEGGAVQGAGAARVVVVPNGVNTRRIRAVTPDLDGDPVVVFVGTLKPWHGVEDLLEAAAMARRPWRLRIVGDGPQREAVEQAAARHGLAVELTGAVAPEEVPAALEGALVAVAPYPASDDHYFSPLKVYEYGAAALPVVASRIGQIPAVVQDGVTGVLVPPSDPVALAAAVDALVDDPDAARALGAAARRLMEREHSWEHVLDATLAPVTSTAPPASPHTSVPAAGGR
ncbi:glycosyl transferase family 1 [Serinicoccus chungangensis]|uniref:Glycosyl transferase family 1 n=1 Tax=Serinicoccus chungangensis TaxID=767452 RepID=A0A0W8IET9_9MICO|nr:glycosyltransferase family 4 protein [Serinicoccus chungangensis]KUG58465.1 glycosyl transferase family 1 [Serinicoccus chungangensis]